MRRPLSLASSPKIARPVAARRVNIARIHVDRRGDGGQVDYCTGVDYMRERDAAAMRKAWHATGEQWAHMVGSRATENDVLNKNIWTTY